MIYVDSENRCHTTKPDGDFCEVEHPFFYGKCDTFIEGFCAELDANGNVKKSYPWKPYSELDAAQREHEKALIAEYESALAEIETALGV